MTAPGWGIDADLAISVDDGAGATATGRLTGHGQQLHLRMDRPEVLIGAAGRRTGAALAGQVAATGIRAELHGPRGRVAVLDPGRTSRVGAVVLGNRHLRVDPAGWGVLARSVVSPRRALLAGAAAVAGLLVLRHLF